MILKNIPIKSVPRSSVPNVPETKAFDAILNSFLQVELVDTSKESVDPELVALLSKEGPNELFKRLKLHEKDFDGSVNVGPVVVGKQAIILVTARIVCDDGKSRTLYSRGLMISFSAPGKPPIVERAPNTKQRIPG